MTLLLAVMGAALAASASGADTTSGPDQRAAATRVGADPAPDRISAFAWIRPRDGVLVLTGPSSEFGYRITHLDVREGDMVEQGQPLAELDVQRERAASLAVARTRVREAQVNADFTAQELARKEKVINTRPLPISVEDFDATRHRAHLAEAKLEAAKREASYAEIRLDQATIRAPAAGLVLRLLKHEGEGFSPGEGVIELGQVAHMQAVAEVFETHVRFVRPGQRATFDSSALAHAVHGKVLRIMPRLDRIKLYETNAAKNTETRVVRVVIGLDDDPAIRTLTGLQGIVTIHIPPVS